MKGPNKTTQTQKFKDVWDNKKYTFLNWSIKLSSEFGSHKHK